VLRVRVLFTVADAQQRIPTMNRFTASGWPKAAGVGPSATPQPTPGPDGPLPSQEGISLRLPNLHRAAPGGVGAPMKITDRVHLLASGSLRIGMSHASDWAVRGETQRSLFLCFLAGKRTS
jgi:hypothetical protein